MFAFFESRIHPTGPPRGTPPPGLLAFYWHFVRQTRGLYLAMFATGLGVALIDTLIPVFIGKLVTLMQATDRVAAFASATPTLIAMAATVLFGRPAAMLADSLVRNNAVVPNVTSLIRWQSHWHVVRQSWPFFQNDFAGRIANRVMQTGNAVRECVVSSIRALWYIGIYGVSSLVLMASADWRLAVPTLLWFAGYVFFLAYFVPRMRDRAKISSELRSMVMGRVVDSYTNILTVKLFARARDEDAYVREVIDDHTGALALHMRVTTRFMATLAVMNALLLVGTAAIGMLLWAQGQVAAGIVATVLPLAWQIASVAGWVSWEVTGIFENVGVVQEGMQTIAVPHTLVDAPDAVALVVQPAPRGGEIRIEHLSFTYGRADGRRVLDDLNLVIRPRRTHRPDRPLGRRQVDAGQPAAALSRKRKRQHPHRRAGHCPGHPGESARGRSAWSRRTPRCCTVRSARTSVTDTPTRAPPRSSPRRRRRRRTSSSSTCRTGTTAPATTRTSANAA